MNEETLLEVQGAADGQSPQGSLPPIPSFPGTVGSCKACRLAVSKAFGERPDIFVWFHLGWTGLCVRHRDGAKAAG